MFRTHATNDSPVVIDKIRTSEFLHGMAEASWRQGRRRRRLQIRLDEFPSLTFHAAILAAVCREVGATAGQDGAPEVRLADRYRKVASR